MSINFFFSNLRFVRRCDRTLATFSLLSLDSSEMELQEEVKRGGLYWLREVLEEFSWEVREGWNMEKEWVRETLALFPNIAILPPVWRGRYWGRREAEGRTGGRARVSPHRVYPRTTVWILDWNFITNKLQFHILNFILATWQRTIVKD